MDNKKHKIAKLLAANASQVQVARAVGVSESYITQLLTDDAAFLNYYSNLISVDLEASHDLETEYKDLELGIVRGMQEQTSTADMNELSKALMAVATVRGKTFRGARGAGQGNNTVAVAVNVSLPDYIKEEFTVTANARNEIVTVNDRCMSGLTEKQFLGILPTVSSEVQDNDTGKHQTDKSTGGRLEEIARLADGL